MPQGGGVGLLSLVALPSAVRTEGNRAAAADGNNEEE